MSTSRILGIDPGTRRAGYGCVELRALRATYVSHGVLELGTSNDPIGLRLEKLFQGVRAQLSVTGANLLALERAFFARNAQSALKLGEARGVVLLAAAQAQVQVVEYAPAQIKAAVAGFGNATKEDLLRVLGMVLGVRDLSARTVAFDASDALAVALCAALTPAPLTSLVVAET